MYANSFLLDYENIITYKHVMHKNKIIKVQNIISNKTKNLTYYNL